MGLLICKFLYFGALKLRRTAIRRGVRVVEGARLESVYTSKGYRGFESRSLRRNKMVETE